MKNKKNILIAVVFIMMSSFAYAQGSFSQVNAQFYQPTITDFYTQQDISTYWPALNNLDSAQCIGRNDFLVQIAPAGCEPAVVRSDILEEQNVPVFCRLDAVKLNPLIDVRAIDRIIPSVRGTMPKEIAGLGFHPAQAAIRSSGSLLGSPLLNNIGYAVVILKQNPAEKNMPDYVTANLTAVLRYDFGNAWDVGRSEYYLPLMSDSQWADDYRRYEFWNGKGYLKLDWLDEASASVSVYSDKDKKTDSRVLKAGETSKDIYMPGYYCLAGMQLRMNGFASPEISAILQVGNDKIEVRKNSRFFNEQCSVGNIESLGGGAGRIEIICGSERQTLALEISNVRLRINNDNGKDYAVGDNLPSTSTGLNRYLVYLGKVPNSIKMSSDEARQFAVIVTTSQTDTQIRQDYIKTRISDYMRISARDMKLADLEKFKAGVINAAKISSDYKVDVLFNFDGQRGISGDAEFLGNGLDEREYSNLGDEKKDAGKKIEEYFSVSKAGYSDISAKYSGEKIAETGNKDAYGEVSLFAAAELAGKIGKKLSQREMLVQLISRYPNGNYRSSAEIILQKLSSVKNAGSSYNFKKPLVNVELLEIRDVREEDLSAEIVYRNSGGENALKTIMQNEYVDEMSNSQYIKLVKIEEKQATIEYNCQQRTGTGSNMQMRSTGRQQIVIKEKFSERICDSSVYVDKINYKKLARISIIPNIKGSESEVNFSFKIGIEKRAIQLSDSKTREMISNLNKTIKKWEDINSRLGDVVSGLKGVCFATSAFLQAKTLLTGFEGGTMARGWAMRGRNGEGGWMELCEQAVSSGQLNGRKVSYSSVDDCLNKNSGEIGKSVSYYETQIKSENARIKELEQAAGMTTDMWGQKSVPTDVYRAKQVESLMSAYKNENTQGVSADGKRVSVSEVLGKVKNTDILTIDDMNSIEINMRILQDSGAPELARIQAQRNLYSVLQRIDSARESADPGGASERLGMTVDSYQEKGSFQAMYRGKLLTRALYDAGVNQSGEKADETPVQAINFNGRTYVVSLTRVNNNQYSPEAFYELDSNNKVVRVFRRSDRETTPEKTAFNTLSARFSQFTRVDSSSYHNTYKNPQVRYWETEPYRGMPAIVPIDVKDGWYAATKQTLPTSGNIKPYESSGRVTSFWLCNVGENGLEQFSQGMGDDICELINLQTGQSLAVFPGLTNEQANQLVQKAQKLLMEAAEKRQAGGATGSVTLSSGTFKVGEPATGQLGTRCQDFMSPEDCYTLFNVCDPVICPTSRCNLGGNYYVDNVVQSGIIGSIALCLPNAREGIMIPVCLTGIHAGIEGYASIMKAHRDCLSESLSSGKHIGICDEIYSIYLCEFFWRQLAPLMNIFIPKLIESAYGQGTRGGGEYLTVMNAWQNMEKSVDYFTSYYAANAVKSFQIKNTQEVGTTVCKAFVSTKYANLKLLLEPESPTQFYATFSEIPYTEATVPATSQYKVYYHIYAGEDSGVYYSVYLKNPPATSFYQSYGTVNVETGFAAKGQTVDKTKDFTAPKGYQELCVRINDKEECGFKQVTSDFALNYVQDKYMEEQATQQITNEKECISGTSSAYALAQPNLQSGAEEVITPQLYNRGITRICASKDPGSSSEPGRWKLVGYCDSSKKVGCWTDSSQIREVIRNKGIENYTLAQIDGMNAGNLFGMSYEQKVAQTSSDIRNLREIIIPQFGKSVSGFSESKIGSSGFNNALREFDNSLYNVSDRIDNAILSSVQNNQRVQLMFLKARLFDNATRIIYGFFEEEIQKQAREQRTEINTPTSGSSETASKTSGTGEEEFAQEPAASFWTSSVPLGNNFDKGIEAEAKLSAKEKAIFKLDDGLHYFGVLSIANEQARVGFASEFESDNFKIGDEREYDLTGDGADDIRVKLKEISSDWYTFGLGGKKAVFKIRKIISEESMPSEETGSWQSYVLSEWDDNDLKQNVLIAIESVSATNLVTTRLYRYAGDNKWVSNGDSAFVNRKLGYAAGVIELVGSMGAGDEITIGVGGETNVKTLGQDRELSEAVLNLLKK